MIVKHYIHDDRFVVEVIPKDREESEKARKFIEWVELNAENEKIVKDEEKEIIEKLDYELTESYVHDIGISKETLKLFKDMIEKQQKEIEALKIIHETYKEVVDKGEFVSKNKIRDKIKEYETTLNQNLFTKIQVIEHGFPKENIIQIMIKAKVEILKELLEE